MELMDKHMGMLERYSAKFIQANTADWEKIITKVADNIQRTWQEDTEFDRDTTISVFDLPLLHWAILTYF